MVPNYTDHSANERTFLAWVRTAIAVAGFGLLVGRLDAGRSALWSEIGLFASGGVLIFVAWLRVRALSRRIEATEQLELGGQVLDGLLMAMLLALIAMLVMFTLHVGR